MDDTVFLFMIAANRDLNESISFSYMAIGIF